MPPSPTSWKWIRIKSWLPGAATQNGEKYYRKAILKCGHIVKVSVGLSPNHYRIGGPEEPKHGRCVDCLKKENGLA
jgi:hypothetical protein